MFNSKSWASVAGVLLVIYLLLKNKDFYRNQKSIPIEGAVCSIQSFRSNLSITMCSGEVIALDRYDDNLKKYILKGDSVYKLGGSNQITTVRYKGVNREIKLWSASNYPEMQVSPTDAEYK